MTAIPTTLEEFDAVHHELMAGVVIIPNIETYRGGIPTGYELVVWDEDSGPEDAMVLYGFDEIGSYSWIKKPVYGFYPMMEI